MVMRAAPQSRAPRFRLSASALAAACAVLAAGQTWAQEATTPQRVEITGSAIKRIDGETALPVQVITREEIVKAGLTTAAEIVAKVAANSNARTDGISVGYGGFRDQTGFNSANLRGIGTSSTLVLLNGRRMANFASPGDDSGVDLNNIPAAAIQRVEVLLDGASAIYGTDAIGGVINFITRKDFQGVELNAYAGDTHEGGAGKTSASIAAGFGNPSKDGFNVFGVFDAQTTSALNANQRRFISDLKIPERLPFLLSSASFPGNIRLSSSQRDILQAENFSTNGTSVIDSRTINLSAPNCNPPHSLYLPGGIGGVDGCTYDYMRDLELYPKTEKLSLLTRGVMNLGTDHTLFAEMALTRAKSYYVGTSNRIDADIDVSLVPRLRDTALGALAADDEDRIITVRNRMLEAGGRTSELTSTGSRFVLGMTGTLAGWDYDWGLNHSVNTVADRDKHGYLNETMVANGFASGEINPFGPSSAAGLAILQAAQIDQEVRKARGTMDSIDFKASRGLAKLDGGTMALALGGEFRREAQSFHQSELLAQDLILGDTSQGANQDTSNSRNVAGLFAELSAPITKQLELQFAVRHDRYDVIGGSTNPKIGLRFQPSKEMLFRASAGTGFRAPSLSDLYRPTTGGSTATLPDPLCMQETDGDLATCADIFSTRNYSNPDLKPERSTQFSLGAVFEPSANLSFSVDYWSIRKRDLISTIGDEVILSNLDKYGSLVHRYSDPAGPADSDFMIQCGDFLDETDTSICYVELHKQNRGGQKSSGLDLMAEVRDIKTSLGTFSARLAGTWMLESKKQSGNGDPYISDLGKFVNNGVVQRWRHHLSLDWERGDFAATLGNTYISGYTDQNSAFDDTVGATVAPNKVSAYSLWDLSGSWQATKELRLRAGVQNLFDTAPPFSNQAYFFISGYDPSYTDPRGRFFYVSAQYKFK